MNSKYTNSVNQNKKFISPNINSDNMTLASNNKDLGNINSSNSASLKGKLTTLEESIEEIKNEMHQHKLEVSCFKTDKDNIQDYLKSKTQEVKDSLIVELEKVEEEMKRHFAHQKAENSRLQQQISQLKSEKTTLSNQLMYLKNRIQELELQVGNDDMNI